MFFFQVAINQIFFVMFSYFLFATTKIKNRKIHFHSTLFSFFMFIFFSFIYRFVITTFTTTFATHKTLIHINQPKTIKTMPNNTKRRECHVYAGDLPENERRRRLGAVPVPDMRQELPQATSFAATHERRVHRNTAALSLRTVPIEIPPQVPLGPSLELEARHHYAPLAHAPQPQVRKRCQEGEQPRGQSGNDKLTHEQL